MGQTISLAAMYCFCSAASSLCQSCFGTTAPGTSGRKRSVLLLSWAIATALWFQYNVGPGILQQDGTIYKILAWIPKVGDHVHHAWYDSCAKYDNDTPDYDAKGHELDMLAKCAGNGGVYRPTCLATIYFLVNAVVTQAYPALNREAWPAKYALFFFGLLVSVFMSTNPLFDGVYLWLARFGAAIFLFLQQVILIDVAYNWNDDWVERANEADRLSYGSGSSWLQAIIGVCASFYSLSLIGIGILYHVFSGDADHNCPGNVWVITLTLLAIIGMTALQLSSSEEGSLLTSSVISLYTVYLAYAIVSHNPTGECNPRLGQNDVWGITVGLLLTLVSMIWTGWSWSAEARLSVESVQSARAVAPNANTSSGDGGGEDVNLDVPFLAAEEVPTVGLVTDGDASSAQEPRTLTHVWKLNVVMALIACYVAMILTGWGTVNGLDEEHHNAANPTVGRVNMAIMGLSQWLAIGLYTWTLLAPRIFPDRDFS